MNPAWPTVPSCVDLVILRMLQDCRLLTFFYPLNLGSCDNRVYVLISPSEVPAAASGLRFVGKVPGKIALVYVRIVLQCYRSHMEGCAMISEDKR